MQEQPHQRLLQPSCSHRVLQLGTDSSCHLRTPQGGSHWATLLSSKDTPDKLLFFVPPTWDGTRPLQGHALPALSPLSPFTPHFHHREGVRVALVCNCSRMSTTVLQHEDKESCGAEDGAVSLSDPECSGRGGGVSIVLTAPKTPAHRAEMILRPLHLRVVPVEPSCPLSSSSLRIQDRCHGQGALGGSLTFLWG